MPWNLIINKVLNKYFYRLGFSNCDNSKLRIALLFYFNQFFGIELEQLGEINF